MPSRCITPHQSHWSNLIQHIHSLESQHITGPIERPSIQPFPTLYLTRSQPSSLKLPTLATDPYLFFNTNHLLTTQNIYAHPSPKFDSFLDMLLEQDKIEHIHFFPYAIKKHLYLERIVNLGMKQHMVWIQGE